MSLVERVIDGLEERRERIINGDINCIPFTFNKLRSILPGIEQAKYYLISGNTKSGKSQIANYMFLFTPILYAFENPTKVNVKIFYFPLEETPENITLRFMSFLLYTLSNNKIRVAPIDLKSTNADKIVDEEILELLRSGKYQEILKFYEEHVLFLSERNPTGIYKTVKKYAVEHGTEHFKTITINKKDKEGNTIGTMEVQAFDYYEPNDPNEYVLILTDHASLLETEKGLTLRETINKYSEYMIMFRNRYSYIPVLIQQQSTETSNLEAFKNNKIRPTMAGLSDSKYTAKDCTVMLGITSPFSFEIIEYLNYDISKFRNNIRFLEVVLNREGESNDIVPLYFDGATNYFRELPSYKDTTALKKIYNYLSFIRGEIPNAISMLELSNYKNKTIKTLQKKNIFSTFAIQFKNKIKELWQKF